jgi:Tfp pilus assembly protein PilN
MSQQINLFNPAFRKTKQYLFAATMAQIFGLVSVGILLFFTYLTYQTTAMTKRAAISVVQLETEQAQLAKLSAEVALLKNSTLLEDEIKRTETQVQTRVDVVNTLQGGELGSTSGFSDYLRAFARQVVHGVWLTGLTIQNAGKDMAISGRALRPELVPAYIKRLDKEPVMQGKNIATLEMQLPKSDRPMGQPNEPPPVQSAAPRFIEFYLGTIEGEGGKR